MSTSDQNTAAPAPDAPNGGGTAEKPLAAWFALAKMRIALSAGRGVRLNRGDLETLQASPVGAMMEAAHAYGVDAASDAKADPVIMAGARVIAGPVRSPGDDPSAIAQELEDAAFHASPRRAATYRRLAAVLREPEFGEVCDG